MSKFLELRGLIGTLRWNPCHVCGGYTQLACADCRINFGARVFVCTKKACRLEHERKCFGDGRHETQQSLSRWVRDTFPEYQGKYNRFVALLEEVAELGLEVGVSPETIRRVIEIPIRKETERGNIGDRERDPADLYEEVGDVLMNVYAFAEEAGIEAQAALDAKMSKNRARPLSYYQAKTAQKRELGLPTVKKCSCACHNVPDNATACGTKTNMLHEACC
jgi:NTP pyrophosphatase (non-canonical NTP hydrolase)